MADFSYFWEIMCICYFTGGLTIGWWITRWKDQNKRKKTGTGRWDYKDRHLDDKK